MFQGFVLILGFFRKCVFIGEFGSSDSIIVMTRLCDLPRSGFSEIGFDSHFLF